VDVAVDATAVPAGAKLAPHVRGPSSAIAWLGVVPEQWPVHPAKTYPGSAVACTPTVIGAGMVTAQAPAPVPQLMPELPPPHKVVSWYVPI